MALIYCSECGKKYSSNAKVCPECANPTPKVIKEEIVYKEPEVVKPVKKEKKPVDGVKLYRILISVGVILFLITRVLYMITRYSFLGFFLSGIIMLVFYIVLILAVVFNSLGAFHKKDGLLPKIATFLLFFAGIYYLVIEGYYFIDELITYSKYFGLHISIDIYFIRQIISIIMFSIVPCLFGLASLFTIKDYDKYKDKAKLNKMTIIAFVGSVLSSVIVVIMFIIKIIIALFDIVI